MKTESKIEDLTSGLPDSLRKFMEHVTKLQFTEEPNYAEIKANFLEDIAKLQTETGMLKEDSKIHCLDWCEEDCSIRRHLMERMAYQKKKEEAESDALQGCRKETVFTQSEEFYSDTMEKPSDDHLRASQFEVPMFRTEQS